MQNEEIKKTKLVRKLLIGFVALITIIISITIIIAIKSQKVVHSPTLSVQNVTIQLEVAKTAAQKAKGLCCRNYLDASTGMLFVYEEPGMYRFWMKDTFIPLDMYWIDSNKRIVHIEHSVQPASYPTRYGSPEPAQYILETNAGFAKQHTISVGDTVSF